MISSINDANGCSNLGTGVVSVEVLNTPIANFDFYPQPVSIADPEVTFINNSFFAQSWTWYFGDGFFNSSEFNPTHKYSESGDYFVYLIVNNGQCVDLSLIHI